MAFSGNEKTRLSVIGTPGRRQVFSAKTAAAVFTITVPIALKGEWKEQVQLIGQWKEQVILEGEWKEQVKLKGNIK